MPRVNALSPEPLPVALPILKSDPLSLLIRPSATWRAVRLDRAQTYSRSLGSRPGLIPTLSMDSQPGGQRKADCFRLQHGKCHRWDRVPIRVRDAGPDPSRPPSPPSGHSSSRDRRTRAFHLPPALRVRSATVPGRPLPGKTPWGGRSIRFPVGRWSARYMQRARQATRQHAVEPRWASMNAEQPWPCEGK